MGFANECPHIFFKHFKLWNYFLRKSNILISNTLITQNFIETYHLRPLKSTSKTLVIISFFIIPNLGCVWTLLSHLSHSYYSIYPYLGSFKNKYIPNISLFTNYQVHLYSFAKHFFYYYYQFILKKIKINIRRKKNYTQKVIFIHEIYTLVTSSPLKYIWKVVWIFIISSRGVSPFFLTFLSLL